MTDSIKRRSGITYIERSGLGPTIVFLHGIGSNASSFTPLIDILPDSTNILAWNAPGYLGSEPLAEAWPKPANYSDALARFLNDVGSEKVHLVGHSLGCLIAADFAGRFSDRLESLVLASAANGYDIQPKGQLPAKVAARIDDLERLGPKAYAKARAANLVYDPQNNVGAVKRVETKMAQINPTGYAQAVRMLASGNLVRSIADVKICPKFIIGAEDKVTLIDQTLAVASAWETVHGCTPPIITIEDSGHAVYVQKPKQFATALLELIADDAAKTAQATAENIVGD